VVSTAEDSYNIFRPNFDPEDQPEDIDEEIDQEKKTIKKIKSMNKKKTES
jgi:hypothetical protein